MSFDEFKQMTERVIAQWKRGEYVEALADAERTYAIETGELAPHGYAHAAWGLISVYTGLKRYEDARRIFEEVIDAKALFATRVERDAEAMEKVLIAGACIAWESGDFAAQTRTMRRASDRRQPESAELAYAYASFFARVADHRAWKALDAAIAKGTPVTKVLADEDLVSLHADSKWERIVEKDRPWKLESHPPGARIFIDDVDTGVVTPGRVKPTAKKHRVRLVLDGYADEVQELMGGNLSYGCHLKSLAEVEAGRRMAEDSARLPDDAARAKTRAFIGDVRRARIIATRHTTYGLGSLRIEVRGDGRVVLDRGTFMPTDKEIHHEVHAGAGVEALFESFIAAAFTELVIANQPGMPDELYFDLVLEGEGGTCKLGKFGSKPHARFEALVMAVRDFAAKAVDPTLHEALTL